MTDLVKRLRYPWTHTENSSTVADWNVLRIEAADRIEQLEAEIAKLIEQIKSGLSPIQKRMQSGEARAALGQERGRDEEIIDQLIEGKLDSAVG